MPVVLVAVIAAVRWFSVRKIEWRTGLVSLVALATGVVVHPNFPANLDLFSIQNVTVLVDTVWAGRAATHVAHEVEPFELPNSSILVQGSQALPKFRLP